MTTGVEQIVRNIESLLTKLDTQMVEEREASQNSAKKADEAFEIAKYAARISTNVSRPKKEDVSVESKESKEIIDTLDLVDKINRSRERAHVNIAEVRTELKELREKASNTKLKEGTEGVNPNKNPYIEAKKKDMQKYIKVHKQRVSQQRRNLEKLESNMNKFLYGP